VSSAGTAWMSNAYYGYYTQVMYPQNAQVPYYIGTGGNDVPQMDVSDH
jgi:hypothetical protein